MQPSSTSPGDSGDSRCGQRSGAARERTAAAPPQHQALAEHRHGDGPRRDIGRPATAYQYERSCGFAAKTSVRSWSGMPSAGVVMARVHQLWSDHQTFPPSVLER